jgi:biopolymer transport protein ExbB
LIPTLGRKRNVPLWLVVAATVALAGGLTLGQPAPAGPAAAQPAPAAAPAPNAAPTAAAAPKTQVTQTKMSFVQLLAKGGWFMVPILLASMLGVAIVFERFVALRRGSIIPSRFMAGLKAVYRDPVKDRQAALDYCHSNRCPISRVIAAGVRKIHQGEEAVEQAIEDVGANEVAKLRRNLRMLYGVSAVSPMLGLLGTVWGMIQAFQAVENAGLGKAGALARGIYEALVTTLAGLMVAIPILIFYYHFLGKIDRIVSEMNEISEEFIEHTGLSEVPAAPVPPRLPERPAAPRAAAVATT